MQTITRIIVHGFKVSNPRVAISRRRGEQILLLPVAEKDVVSKNSLAVDWWFVVGSILTCLTHFHTVVVVHLRTRVSICLFMATGITIRS